MFKKLFISFLILSALTSEGISVIPANYAALCSSVNEAGILSELNASVSKEQVNSNGRSFLNGSSSDSAFLLTQKSIEKLKYKNSYLIYSETANEGYLRASSKIAGLLPASGTEKDDSFSDSGLSPPVNSNNI